MNDIDKARLKKRIAHILEDYIDADLNNVVEKVINIVAEEHDLNEIRTRAIRDKNDKDYL